MTNPPPNQPTDSTFLPPEAPQPASTPAPRKRRRWPWVLLVLFVLLILLVLLIPTLASTAPVRSIVISKINNNLNGKLDVADWSIGWTSGVTLNGIKLDDDKGKRVAEISSIRLPVSLMGAARGNYDLGEVVIDKPNLVNVEVYPDGSTNLDKLAKESVDKAKAEPKTTTSSASSKLPDVKGKITIKEARGTIAFPGSTRPPIFLDPTDVAIDIPGINEPITNKIKLAYHVGSAPPGTIAIDGSVKAINNNTIDIEHLKADQSIQLAAVDLSAFAPFMKTGNEGIDLAGLARGSLQIKADTIKAATVGGSLNVDNLAVGGAPLKGDSYKSTILNIPINVSVTPQGETSLVKIEKLQVESDHMLVDVTGQATQGALENLASQKAPGSTGGFAIAISTKDKALPALVNSFRNSLGLQKEVQILAGDFKTNVNLDLAADKATVKQTLDVNATGLNSGKQIKLDPVHIDTGVTAIPTGQPIPDLRDIALNVTTSGYAYVGGGGKSLDDLDIHGDFDLAKLQAQLAQFVDLQGKSFAGTGKFVVTSKGDLTKLGGTSDVAVNVTLSNIAASGLAEQGAITQPHAVVSATAKLQRGPTDAADFITSIPAAQLTVQSGDPASPVLDLLATATNVTNPMNKPSVEKFEVQKLSVPNLAQVQQQFAAFFPPDFRAASGSVYVTAAGSFVNDVLTFDQKAQLRSVTLQKLDANKQPRTLLENETEDINSTGSIQLVDADTKKITLTALSATSSNKLFAISKTGDQPVVLTMHKEAIAGNGEITISSDLKRVLDALQAFSTGPAAAPNAPGQLTSGTFAANLKLAQTDKGGTINLDGGIDNLSVTTSQQPIANERVAINVAATTPPDMKSVSVSSATINSSFAKTTITDALLQLTGGTFDMLQKAKVQVAVPDMNKAMTVAQAFSPPANEAGAWKAVPVTGASVQSTANPTVRPATQPIEPLQISGGAVIDLNVMRDTATQTTLVNIPQIAASKVSLVRGQRSYTFDKPINLKLVAALATENITTPPSTQPTQSIKQIDIKHLEGDLGGLATLAMPTPLSVTNLTAPTPSANGKIALTGPIEPLTRMLSVIQDADAMPYTGDYAIYQTVGTQNNKIKLTGDATINKLVVLQADRKTPAFSEDKLVVSNDLVADTTTKTATINNLALDMTTSKAAGVALKGKITDWEHQRALEGVALNLSYDLAKLWTLAKPMLSPEMQANYADFKVAGVYQKTINLSGSFPANPDWHQSIKSLNADGAIAIQEAYTSGLQMNDFELPFTVEKGILTTLYKDKPKAERAPKPARINDGAGDFGSMLVDLTAPEPVLSIGKNQQLLKDVKLNPIFADKLGKFASVLFKDAKEATGYVNITVVECQNVPLGEMITKKNLGKAKVDILVRDLHLNSIPMSLIAKAAQLGDQGIIGELRESSATYAGDSGGVTRSQINIYLTRKGQQIPFTFTGGVGLADMSLHDAIVSIPPQLFGSDEISRVFPQGMKIPITGTLDKYKIDTNSLLKDNVGGIIGGILGGNKKPDSNNAAGDTKDKKPDVGGIIGDILGGNKAQQSQPPPPPPAQPAPKKKKK